jgi:hypothetical protein
VWRGVTDHVQPAQVVWRFDNTRWNQALYSVLGG